MKILIVLSIVIAVTTSSILHFGPTNPLYTSATPVHTANLYHNQDSFGQYSYGYSGGPSIKSEQKTIDGVTRGTYSYIDSDGNLQSVQYTADAEHGFRVAATNLPIAPTNENLIAPEPVQDTPEVVQARIEHLNAFRVAELRAAKDENEVDENGMPISSKTSNNNDIISSTHSVEIENSANNNNNNNTNNNIENIENNSGIDNLRNSNEDIPPADNTKQLLSLDYNDLRPVNIPIPATSYIHVSTPAHAYSTRIYGPTLYSYSIPRSFTAYTKGISGPYYNSGYLLTNNNEFASDNIISSGHITNENSEIENIH